MTNNPPKKILFSLNTTVRIDDINFGNHLCHSKFAPLFHQARAVYLKNNKLSEIDCFGMSMVMLSLHIDYHSQCLFNDLLEVTMHVDILEKASMTFFYSIYNHTSKKQAATGTTKMGFVDRLTGKLKRIPLEFTTLIQTEPKQLRE